MNPVTVVNYCYDTGSGMLGAELDPRTGLETRYSYNSYGQIATVTSPGVDAWNFTYAPIGSEPAGTGRLATIYRAEVGTTYDATTTYTYGIGLSHIGFAGWSVQHDAERRRGPATRRPPDRRDRVDPPTVTGMTSSSNTSSRCRRLRRRQRSARQRRRTGGLHFHDGVRQCRQRHSDPQVPRTDKKPSARAVARSSRPPSRGCLTPRTPTTRLTMTGLSTLGPAHIVAMPTGTGLACQSVINGYDSGSPGSVEHDFVTSRVEEALPVGSTTAQDARELTTPTALAATTPAGRWRALADHHRPLGRAHTCI